MKKSSRRALSRLLASVMLITSIFGTTYVNGADNNAFVTYAASAEDVVTSANAVAGETYEIDLRTLSADTVLDSFTSGGVFEYNNAGGGKYHNADYGLAVKPNDTFKVAVAGNADISLLLSSYAPDDGTFAVTDAEGADKGSVSAQVATDKTENTYSYKGEATVLTFTYSGGGQGYLAKITVANAEAPIAPIGEAKNFELWLDDIAKDVESGVDEAGNPVITKTIEQQTLTYKDSTLTLVADKDGVFTPKRPEYENYDYGVKVATAYQGGSRNASPNDIQTIPTFGDGSAAVFTPAATGLFNTYFYSGKVIRVWDFDTATGSRYGYTESQAGPGSYAVKVIPGHTYVVSTTGGTSNTAYAGFEYVIDEDIDVEFSFNNKNADPNSIPSLEVFLTDAALGTEECTVTESKTKFTLAKGHTYKLTTNDGGVKATVGGKDYFKATEATVAIDLENVPDKTLTGEITGTPEGTVSELTFKNQINGKVFTATITGSTYSCVMKPGDYDTTVVTNNGGVTYDHVKVLQDVEENTNEVYVEVPVDDGSKNYDLPTEVVNAETALTLTGIKANNPTSVSGAAGSSIVVPVSGVQKVTVAGWYAGTWDINGQNSVTTNSNANAANPTTNSYITNGTENSVTVNITGTSANYLYWIKVENCIPFTSEINVPQDYATLNEADDAICAMVNRPDGEEGRVTINLNADLEEQVTFDAPYVTLKGNGHTLSWYYGVGTYYYSIDAATGLYNERLFRDKYASNEANSSLWGGVAIIRGDNFIAEDTTFKNTYNYYVTDKEVPDVAYTVGGIPMRTKDTDVTAYASKERSNAFYIAANNIEAYRCNILSSQDTLGRNGSADNGYHTYFKDCVIAGNTDYICGEFTAIFDNCELQWKSFKDDPTNNSKVGYIVAPKTNPYIFRNCTVTTDGVGFDVMGCYGRTWGAGSNTIFINTETNGYIKDVGWDEMNSGDYVSSTFKEYGNTSKGEPFVTKAGTSTKGNSMEPKVLSDADAAAMTSDEVITTYLANWTPVHYSYETRFEGVWGDADMSGVLTANDASAVLAYVLNSAIADSGSYDFRGCDVDDSGEITANDASMILQKVLDSEFAFPAEPTTESTTEAMPIDEEPEYIPTAAASQNDIVYNGYDATILAVQPMKYSELDPADPTSEPTLTALKTAYGRDYNKWAYSSGVNTMVSIDSGATSGNYRIAYEITAKNNTTVNVDVKVNGTKAVYIATTDGSKGTNAAGVEYQNFTPLAGFMNDGEDGYFTISADVKAGDVVYVIGAGTNPPIYAVRFDTPSEYIPTAAASQNDIVLDNADATILAVQPMKYSELDPADPTSEPTLTALKTAYGRDYNKWAYSSGVNTMVSIDSGATSGNYRIAYEITIKKDTTVNVDTKVNGTKAVYIATTDGSKGTNAAGVEYQNFTPLAGFKNDGDDGYFTISADVKAGDVVYVIGAGTNPPIYAVRFGKGTQEETSTETTTEGEPINVFVVGDSTGCHYADTEDTNYYYKRVGFGDKLADYATSNVTVVNLALSGRSSKSFTSEANYTTLTNDIKAGDILLIVFGHNDEKSGDTARYTAPNGVWDSATGTYTEGSFKDSLYTNYVKPALDKGATPIVCSPIVRRTDSGTWSDSQLHKANGGDYAADAKALAQEQNIGFIDLTALTQAKYDELTPAKSVNLHAWTNSKSTSVDNTHLNNYGAKEVAYLIATNPTAELAPYIAANPVEPTEKDLVVNPDYVESGDDDLTGDELNSVLWTTTSPWRGTVFGDIGGTDKLNGKAADGVTFDPTTLADANGDGVPNFLISENSDGSVRIKAGTPNTDDTASESFGKIAGSSDGLAMYYQPVDVKQNFTISAKAHVTNVDNTYNQVAFGAIVADKVLVDVNNKIMITNYVAASPLKMLATVGTTDATGATVTAWAGYARIADVLTQGGELATREELPKGGDVIDVKITKLGNKYTVEYNGKVSEFTVDMTGTVYVGLFAARCADVTYTDIVYNNEVVE